MHYAYDLWSWQYLVHKRSYLYTLLTCLDCEEAKNNDNKQGNGGSAVYYEEADLYRVVEDVDYIIGYGADTNDDEETEE